MPSFWDKILLEVILLGTHRRKAVTLDMERYLENRQRFLENRQRFPMEELANYAGRWVAWSPDGTRIVASAADADLLEQLVCAAGEDSTQCVIEGIPEHDSLIAGGCQVEDA